MGNIVGVTGLLLFWGKVPSGSCYLGHRQLLFWGGWRELLFLEGGEWRGTEGAPHCGVPSTLGAHPHIEAKVGEGGKVGWMRREAEEGWSVAARKLRLEPTRARGSGSA